MFHKVVRNQNLFVTYVILKVHFCYHYKQLRKRVHFEVQLWLIRLKKFQCFIVYYFNLLKSEWAADGLIKTLCMFAQYGFALKGLVQHFRVHIFGIHLSYSGQMAKRKRNFQTLGINPAWAPLLNEILMGYDYCSASFLGRMQLQKV